jgi:hypothetical protein
VHTFHLVITCLAIVMIASAAIGALVHADFVAKPATEVGVTRSQLPLLGALKLAGAIGLLLGLLGVPYIGVAAAIGLVVYFIGAVVAHVRARAFYNIYAPALFLAIAALTLAGA